MNSEKTYAYLSECFVCDEVSGQLVWKLRPEHHALTKSSKTRNAKRAGTVAGFKSTLGYCVVALDRTHIPVHRIIFAMSNRIGLADIAGFIDHIDGDRFNNKISNLRQATSSENAYNADIWANNSAGLKGVHYVPETGHWRARIHSRDGRVNLGTFPSKEEAAAAYIGAAIILHGEFFRDPRNQTQAAA